MQRAWLVLTITLAASVAASEAQSVPAHPDLSGYWELRYDSLSVPRAALTPGAAITETEQARKDAQAISKCEPAGLAALMSDRGLLDLRQSPTVIGIVAKLPSSTRFIYTDGREHPPLDEYEPTTNGHSVGHWEGDTLVVSTVGLGERGVKSIPGGGFRTSESRLVERFRLLNDGQRLSVTFTWEDPKVFQQPHTYEYRYYRLKEITLPRVYQCNPSDPERTRFLTEPPRSR